MIRYAFLRINMMVIFHLSEEKSIPVSPGAILTGGMYDEMDM